jgi:hypothetical protein
MTVGWGLILLTILLVALGCALYVGGQIGWAQHGRTGGMMDMARGGGHNL